MYITICVHIHIHVMNMYIHISSHCIPYSLSHSPEWDNEYPNTNGINSSH